MKRPRQLAILGAVSLLVLLAGFYGGFWSAPVEHTVVVNNFNDSANSVSVQISKDGETVRARETVKPGGKWNVTTLSAEGDYEIAVTVDNERMKRETVTLPLATDGASFTVFSIQENGSVKSSTHWQE